MHSQALSSSPSLLGTRPPWAPVIDDIHFSQCKVDWSCWYLTEEEDMGEGAEQAQIIYMLLSILSELASEHQWKDVLWSGDQFFAWRQDHPLVRVSPDVYLLDHPPTPPLPLMWETWRPGHRPPRFAIEIVSQDWKKDYEQSPAKYAQLGTQELVIFDPDAALGRTKNPQRYPLLVYRRSEEGAMSRVYAGEGPAFSEQLEAWLVVWKRGGTVRLRLAYDVLGNELIPTTEERKDQERMRAEQEQKRARQEQERAEQAQKKAEQAQERAEQEQARAEVAEQRLRELEIELQRYKSRTSR